MGLKFLGSAVAIIALSVQPAAAATQQMCLTRDEVRMGLSYITPILVEGIVESCTPYMPPESQLLLHGPKMAENYRAIANATDEDMMALAAKIGDVTGDPPPPMLLETLKTELVAEMAKDIKAEDCAIADQFAADMSALPATNILGLIETGIFMAELKDRQKKAKRLKKPIAASIFCAN
jgi:hypothetical protein